MLLQSLLVDGRHGSVGHDTRVGQTAGVLLSIGGHDRDIFLAHFLAVLLAEGDEAIGDIHIAGQFANGLDGSFSGLVGGVTFGAFTEQLGDAAETAAGSDEVVFADVGKQNGVAFTVGQIVEAAQLMSHGMNMTEAGVVEGHAGKVFSIAHAFAGFLVLTVGNGATQITVDVFDGLFSAGVRHGSGSGGYIGFHGMSQSIHAGSGGQGRRHTHHENGVVNGDAGSAAPVDDGHLNLAGNVGDDAEAGHFRSGTGSGVHSDVGREGLAGLVHAFVILNLAAVADEEADALAAVMGAAAAEGDEAVAVVFLINGGCVCNILICGVRNGAVKDNIGDAAFIENVSDLLKDTAGDDTLIRYYKRMLGAKALQTVGDFLTAVRTDESHSRNKEGSDLSLVHAFDISAHSNSLIALLSGRIRDLYCICPTAAR